MKKVYHVSPVAGIKVLEPRVSTHGKAYVYGSTNLPFTLIFGSKKLKGDLDGPYGVFTNSGLPFIIEAYEGAIEKLFKGESCSIYELDPTDFESGKTGFGGEIVSEKPVKILKETRVEDIYELLLKYEKQGKIKIFRYSNDKEYQTYIRSHIKDRLMRYGIMHDISSDIFKFCKQHYADILDEIMREQEYFGFIKKNKNKVQQ